MDSKQKYMPLLVVITGPTASGKTTLSVEIASKLNCKIISSDSRQFYKGMKIGSAAPNDEELQRVEHFFIGHLNVNDYYNVSKYEKDVNILLEKLFVENNIALLTGGSGLYIDAVCNGIDDIPDTPPQLRQSLQQQYKENGLENMRAQLQILDPEYYKIVDLNNHNRIMRALEVCISSGKPYSSFRVKAFKKKAYRILKIGIETDREVLYQRINNRVDKMIKDGLIEEVESLLPWRNCNALNTLGYKEIISYLDGKMNLPDAIEKIKVNTRRYARRQITWFKKDKEINWLNYDYEKIFKLIQDNII
jgi:tRNA dimethylallyltransferase